MNVRALLMIALTAGLLGCDKLPFVGKAPEEPAATPEPAGAVQSDVPAQPESAPPPVQSQAPPPPPPRPPSADQRAATPSVGDEVPWTPNFSGIVNPGMTREEVLSIWGDPVLERGDGAWTFLYYRNGCERRYGTYDVVFLEGGQVVDAIVRGSGHTYSGVSSSPPGREPVANVVDFEASGGPS